MKFLVNNRLVSVLMAAVLSSRANLAFVRKSINDPVGPSNLSLKL